MGHTISHMWHGLCPDHTQQDFIWVHAVLEMLKPGPSPAIVKETVVYTSSLYVFLTHYLLSPQKYLLALLMIVKRLILLAVFPTCICISIFPLTELGSHRMYFIPYFIHLILYHGISYTGVS